MSLGTRSLWDRVDERRTEKRRTGAPQHPPARRRFRWVVDAILPFTLTVVAGVAVVLPASLSAEAP